MIKRLRSLNLEALQNSPTTSNAETTEVVCPHCESSHWIRVVTSRYDINTVADTITPQMDAEYKTVCAACRRQADRPEREALQRLSSFQRMRQHEIASQLDSMAAGKNRLEELMKL